MKACLDVSETVLKKEGFNTVDPQEGIANSSHGKPCAGYFTAVRGQAPVYGLIVHMDNQNDLIFDPGKSMPQANPVFPWCLRDSMMQAAEPAPAQEAFVKCFCCA